MNLPIARGDAQQIFWQRLAWSKGLTLSSLKVRIDHHPIVTNECDMYYVYDCRCCVRATTSHTYFGGGDDYWWFFRWKLQPTVCTNHVCLCTSRVLRFCVCVIHTPTGMNLTYLREMIYLPPSTLMVGHLRDSSRFCTEGGLVSLTLFRTPPSWNAWWVA